MRGGAESAIERLPLGASMVRQGDPGLAAHNGRLRVQSGNTVGNRMHDQNGGYLRAQLLFQLDP
jgi:hypothetical protein